MKRSFLIIAFLLAAGFSYADDIPKPTSWVNDFAGVISPEYRDKTTKVIGELEQKTSAEIIVIAVNSIAPYDEKAYARMIFDSWHPGKKGKDNGVLVLLAVKERRWRIETGYGVEGILPDGLCGQIGRNYMVPHFKEGDYGKGLYYGVAAISNVISKDAKISLDNLSGINFRSSASHRKSDDGAGNAVMVFFILALAMPFIVGIIFMLICCFMAVGIFANPGLAIVLIIIYSIFSVFRFFFWRSLPVGKRGNSFFTYGGGYGGGGGGFGGGGFGGGGGGCGGGGGAGGGF